MPGLAAAGCGMRTLDLVDERTSPPVEAAASDTETETETTETDTETNTDTGTSVVTSSGEESTDTATQPLPSSDQSSATEPPLSTDDGDSSSPDAGAPNMCPKERPYYDPVTTGCMECWLDRDCPPERVCAYGGNCERACRSDNQCEAGFFCNQGRCVECRSDFECGLLFGDSKPICDRFWGRCREECTSSFQCAFDEPVCDVESHTCRGCAADNECPAELPVCTVYGRCIAQTPEGSTSEGSTGGPPAFPSTGYTPYGPPSSDVQTSEAATSSGG